jgi:hypothetical protein
MPVAKLSDDKMKVFSYPFECDDDLKEFMKHLDEKGKEVIEHFKKLPIDSGTLKIFYFDVEGEKTYFMYKIEFNY